LNRVRSTGLGFAAGSRRLSYGDRTRLVAHRLIGRALVLTFLTAAAACGGSSSDDSAPSESGGAADSSATATGGRSGSSGSAGGIAGGRAGSGDDLTGGSGGGSGAPAGSGGSGAVSGGTGGDSAGSGGSGGATGGSGTVSGGTGGDSAGSGGDAGQAAPGAGLSIRPSRSPAEVGEAAVGKTGTSPTNLTVSNTGDAPTGLLTVSTSDPQFVFLIDTCSGTSLCSNTSSECSHTCQLGVVLRPTQTGVINGMLTVSDGIDAEVSMEVTGTGTPYCLLTATPDSLDFGSAPVGSTAAWPVTLTNTGDTPSGILAVSLDLNDGRFSIAEDTCDGVSLDPGASCTLTVAYEAHPMSSPNLDIVVTPEVGAPVSIPLDGWGIS